MFHGTMPLYLEQDKPFSVYYMTVSGHMDYNFEGNRMAYKNRQVVEQLPFSTEAKAYLACNYELEKALTYLVEELEKGYLYHDTVLRYSIVKVNK